MTLTGLTLIESLKILNQQDLRPGMQEIVHDLILQISEGSSFSEALSMHRPYFSNLYIALIKAAEKGGLLDKVLGRLADSLEKSEELRKKVKSAMVYPAIVMTGVFVVIVIMNVFVIPQLGGLYQNLNIQLPITTKIVLAFSKGFTAFFIPLSILAVASVFLYKRFGRTEDGEKIIDKVKLKLPVFGDILRLSTLNEISRTLSLLVASGASIIESLKIVANVADNYWYKKAIISTDELVEKGISLSDAMQNANIFPPMLIQMTKVGESTGKIDESLNKISEYFERDLDIRIKTITTAMEPILIISLGIAVGFLILSVITPIYGLISQIQ